MQLFMQDACRDLAIYGDVAGRDPNDPMLITQINNAQRRLLNKTDSPDYLVRFRINCFNGCVTLPREVDGIYGALLDGQEITPFVALSEYVGNGAGRFNIREKLALLDRGSSPLFYDIYGSKKIEVISNSSSDTGKQIRIRGMAGLPSGGSLQSLPAEEKLTIGTSVGVNLSNLWWTKIDTVSKPDTDGQLFVYSYDTVTNNRYLLAIYHTDENSPQYRRYQIPAMRDKTGTLEIIGKRAFIPAKKLSDPLIIQNIDALKFMLMAEAEERLKNLQAAQQLIMGALAEMEATDRSKRLAERPTTGLSFMGTIDNLG